IPLTKKEFMLLGHFIAHPNQVFGREQLIELLWGFDSDTEGRTVDSHIRNMREKSRRAGFPINDYFETVWGMGYKWKVNQIGCFINSVLFIDTPRLNNDKEVHSV